MPASRPTLSGPRHAISAGHYLAASAGYAVLEGGGNAVDAGCAAGIALGVLLPDLVNVAGVAPIMIRLANGQVETIAGLGHWPASLPPDVFMREHGGKIPQGVRRTVVPAAPDAWITALERHGTMGFGDVAQYAIRYAAEGFAVYPLLAESVSAHVAEYARWPSNAAIFLPGGAPPKIGERFIQSDLARSLTYMVEEEKRAASKGRLAGLAAAHAAFYCGDIAREIVAFQSREGGFLTMADMAGFHSRLEPAITRRWRGHEVITCGPWCQGPALLEALLLMERAGLDGLEHNSAEYLHLFTECVKAAMADREYHFGDPAFIDVPIDQLLSDAHLAARVAEMDPVRAHPAMYPPLLGAGRAADGPVRRDLPKIEADTSYVAVVDRWGNAFASRRRGARQAPAPDAEPRHGGDTRWRCDALRHAGRGCADSGHATGDVECAAFWHGIAGSDRSTARLLLRLSVILCSVRLFPASACGGDAYPGSHAQCTRGARA